ncbi:unnamed protein product [Spodoptera littoralis]|uniref:Fatty acyl-CoA reductase n=1 Tax=Spodoptera littoralis TaxID=7109 RepID=A0A9P0I8Z0_SPOLI|nr:unnamed protein product [Spodoptera littoralis]CAH1642354.1 unnamed protein product [Spodoptera littoralis]
MDAAEKVILKALDCQKGTKSVIDRGDSTVQQFYKDSTVFLTGASGFLGKQLVEKLFRSFVYMSTAYSHATYSRGGTEIMEEFYTSPMSPELMIELAESLEEERLNRIKDEPAVVQDIRIDFVPVDYVNNTAIVAAAASNRTTKIYHVATSKRNHLTWGGLTNILNNVARRTIVSPHAIWYCFVVQSPFLWLHQLVSFLLHTIPANLADGACVILKKPPSG